jgi:hypothetical protein
MTSKTSKTLLVPLQMGTLLTASWAGAAWADICQDRAVAACNNQPCPTEDEYFF